MKLIEETRAENLPPEWDTIIGDNLYLRRSFLTFIEKTEKDYKPTYYLFFDGDKADSCFVAHERKGYNLAMFTKFNFKICVTMIYLPMCVTRSGVVFGKCKNAVIEKIKSLKGYKMILNLSEEEQKEGFKDFAIGLTCPKCVLGLRFDSFDDYVNSLRSDYRNRLKKVLKKTEDINIRFIDNKTDFSDALYQMYLNVLGKSRVRIETLSKEYFQGDMFKVFVAEKEGRAIGFIQLLENGSELIFEFVGIDYKYNDELPIYHRMLFEIIRYGIENGFKTIDFGQTADDTKLKLGSDYIRLYAALHHSAGIMRFFSKRLAPYIEYKPLNMNFRVFKEEKE